MPSGRVRVLVAEDHPVTMVGVIELLRTTPDLDVVGAVATARALADQARTERPDALLVDLALADGPAIGVIEALLCEDPTLAVIVLTGTHAEEHAFRALRAGVRGYVTKSMPASRVLEAIRTVAGGGRAIPPEVCADVAAREAQRDLTRRELDVLRLLADGRTNAQIGVALGIGTGTVRTHVAQILEKLGAADRTEAATAALRRGVI